MNIMNGLKSRLLITCLIAAVMALPACRGCSRSGRESLYGKKKVPVEMERNFTARKNQDSVPANIVPMRLARGVYYIPMKVNGIDMEFIFDTGASTISISLTEVQSMRRKGKLNDSDILGASYFSDATGTISEGTRLNLKEVEIGNHVLYDVEASVVHNLKAPLLLGQSALNRFGRITIDYENKSLILE
jgi:aspartyl protease family protein